MKYLKSRWVWQLRYALTMLAVTATILLGSLPSSLAAPSPQHQLVAEAHSMKPPVANLTASDETNGSGPSFIRLQYATFDPLKGEPNIPTNLRASSQAGAGYRYYIVQLSGPVYESQKAQIQQAGGVIFDYIPDYAFIVHLDEQSRQVVSSLPFVRWVGYYQPAYKLATPLIRPDVQQAETQKLVVHTYEQKAADGVAAIVANSLIQRSDRTNDHILTIQANTTQTLAIIGVEGVSWIEPYNQMRGLNDRARAITGVNLIRQNLNLKGDGEIVAMADSGLDLGVLGNAIHPDFRGRVLHGYPLGRAGYWDDPEGHGTHVAGTILGDGSGADGNKWAGVAPHAKLVVQSLWVNNSSWNVPADIRNLFDQAYDPYNAEERARVHNDSYGSVDQYGNPIYGYTGSSRGVDDFLWEKANSNADGEMVIVFGAGNDGSDVDANGYHTGVIQAKGVTAPSSAKNDITVGASENLRPPENHEGGYSDRTWNEWGQTKIPPVSYNDPIGSDYPANNISGMAPFSNRGRAGERIEPSIVAPGTEIISTRSRHFLASNWGFPVPGHEDLYVFQSGTSHAAPQVSGAAALVRQHLIHDLNWPNPSAALVKATLLNSAIDIYPGQYNEITSPRPNNVEGWGRLNVKQAVDPDAPQVFSFKDIKDQAGLRTGKNRAFKYAVSDGTVPLHITVAWTDAPSPANTSGELVNNLDLKVEGPDGAIYWGNRVQDGDTLNNVETVDISNPPVGEYKVIVRARNVAVGGKQPFALAVLGGLGCTDAANTALQRPTAPASCWQQGSTPETEETNILRGVAPITSNDAWAVGSKETFDFSELTPQLLHWNGTAWAVADQPACVTQPLVAAKLASGRRVDDERGDVGKSFNAVAAVSSSDVWAVGQCHYFANDQEVQRTLTMHYDGTGWTKVPAPDANPHFNTLEGLTAVPDSNQIWAVGYARPNEQSPDQPLTMRWDGSGWNTVTAPGYAGEQKLYAVAASTITDVWAVGSSGSDPNTTALLLHNDGSGWANISLNLTSSLTQTLYAVTAIAPNDAWAVGADSNGVLMLHWDGSNWTRTPYSTSLVGNLYSVAALDSRDVWAVGEDTSGQYPAALTLHWDGVTWRQVDAPRPGFQQTLYSVGVNSSEGEVWAVGDSHETYPVAHNLTLYKHYTAATLQSKGGH